MFSKFYLLLAESRDKGTVYALQRIINFFIRPLRDLVKRDVFLVNLFYGILPQLRFFIPLNPAGAGALKFIQTPLVSDVRRFWYSNHSGAFDLEGEKISRKDIFNYGGPNPGFSCPVCQKREWLSRVRQKNLFTAHSCPEAGECEKLCGAQGDELRTNFHQNFNFSIGCDKSLPAPRGIFVDYNFERNFLVPNRDVWILTFRRRLAFAAQAEVVKDVSNINWSKYDFLFLVNNGSNVKFKRPDIPIIMYGHDCWPLEDRGFQWAIDWLQPDVFLAPDLSQWKANFRFSPKTKMTFFSLFDSLFFARPNLEEKEFDLLVAGATTSSSMYGPRFLLNRQIAELTGKYRIEFSLAAGAGNVFKDGGVLGEDLRTGSPLRFLNKWSEYLGRARYVIFGRMKYPSLTHKHFEILGSGAVPILPETPDLKYLGIKPFEHYIPLSEVEGDNQRLANFLDNYEKYRFIAQKAVDWYRANSDKMMFNDFEDLIGEVTGHKYPKRII